MLGWERTWRDADNVESTAERSWNKVLARSGYLPSSSNKYPCDVDARRSLNNRQKYLHRMMTFEALRMEYYSNICLLLMVKTKAHKLGLLRFEMKEKTV